MVWALRLGPDVAGRDHRIIIETVGYLVIFPTLSSFSFRFLHGFMITCTASHYRPHGSVVD